MQGQLALDRTAQRGGLADWLTVEQAAYAGLAALALGVRLYGLGRAPLTPAEAAQALPALAATSEGAAALTSGLVALSPLLHLLQRALFAVFGATDFAARFWPALLGGLAPLLFYALRGRMTRGGALAAAALWAVSPLAVFSARLGLGVGLVPTLALALAAALSAYTAARSPQWLTAAAVSLGLLLLSGPGAYTALVSGVIAAACWPGALPALWAGLRTQRRAALVGLLTAFVLGATGFLSLPSGLAAAFNLLGAWARGLLPGAGAYGAWDVARRLLLSEPLVLGLGAAAGVAAARGRDRWSLGLAAATGLALIVALAGRGRHPADLALAALGLTLLAGPVLARILRRGWLERRNVDAALLVGVSLALLSSAAICLPSASTPANTEAWRALYIGVGLATAVMAALIWLVYGIWGNWRTVRRALPIVLLVLGLVWGAAQMVSLSVGRTPGREPAALAELPSPAAPVLQATLRDLSALKGGASREVRIDLVWPDRPDDPVRPTLRWLLREFVNLRVVAAVPADPAPIVVTPVEEQPLLSDRYSGAEFPVLDRWQPTGLADSNAALRWVLYREAKTAPESESIIVWVDRTLQ